jgi:hypothetical protein
MVEVGFKQTTLLIKIAPECSPLYMTINSNYRNNKSTITSHYLMTLLTARLITEPLIYDFNLARLLNYDQT